MALFQRPAHTPEEVKASQPLEISPAQVLDMDEATWYAKIYRGDDVPQLTVRAVLVGSLLGFLLAFTNLYVGLKTGWALGVAITACILAFALWNVLLRGIFTPMSILELNCVQSTASSAGYSTGGTMVSAISALLMLSATADNPQGEHLPWPVLAAWTILLAALGTLLAIPMKRNLINRERLPFPSGTAAATTLQSLYSQGNEAIKKARALMTAGLVSTLFPIVLDLKLRAKEVVNAVTGNVEIEREPLLPGNSPIFDWLPARGGHEVGGQMVANKPSDWNILLDHNPVLIAAGALVGLRISIYMVIGALIVGYGVGPAAYEYVWTNTAGDAVRAVSHPARAWREVGLWLGVAIMVSSALLLFALQWRTIVRAFRGLSGGKAGDPSGSDAGLVERTEVPLSWFITGCAVSGGGIVWLAHAYFGVPWLYGLLALVMTFFLCLVACRATGESDITPVGAMGKLMQLTYGVLIPQSTTANLMTAGITSGAAGSAADLLNELKSGYLLGANPRRQFIAQFFGVFSGTVATVAGFYLLVPNATVLTGVGDKDPEFAAPAAQAWAAVARLFRDGISNMHPMHQQAIVWGLGIGVALVLLELALPRYRKWLPSATGLGLGMILPTYNAMSMLIGAVIAYVWMRKDKQHAEDYVVPVSAGIIAGVSIVGVIVAVINVLLLE